MDALFLLKDLLRAGVNKEINGAGLKAAAIRACSSAKSELDVLEAGIRSESNRILRRIDDVENFHEKEAAVRSVHYAFGKMKRDITTIRSQVDDFQALIPSYFDDIEKMATSVVEHSEKIRLLGPKVQGVVRQFDQIIDESVA